MKCPNCNQDVEPSAVFCGNCGHQLQQPAAPTAPVDSAGAPQPVTQLAPIQPIQPMAAHVAPVAAPVPAYAMGQTKPKEGSGLLTLAVVFAALSIPGALIPIVGFGFGITAIVLAIKHHHIGTGRLVVSIVLACFGLLLSLAAFGYNISQRAKHLGFVPNSSFMVGASAMERSTPPYKIFVTPDN